MPTPSTSTAQRLAAGDFPEHPARLRTAQHACDRYDTVSSAYHDAWRELRRTSHLPVYDTGAAEQLPDLTEQVQAGQRRVSDLDQRVERLTRDPAVTSLPDPEALLQRAENARTLEQAAAYQRAVSREPSPFVSLSRDPYPAPRGRARPQRPALSRFGTAVASRLPARTAAATNR